MNYKMNTMTKIDKCKEWNEKQSETHTHTHIRTWNEKKKNRWPCAHRSQYRFPMCINIDLVQWLWPIHATRMNWLCLFSTYQRSAILQNIAQIKLYSTVNGTLSPYLLCVLKWNSRENETKTAHIILANKCAVRFAFHCFTYERASPLVLYASSNFSL